MKEKEHVSVSRAAEQRREADWEKNRKATSTVKAVNPEPSEHLGRADQHVTVKGPACGPNDSPVLQVEPGIDSPEEAGPGKTLSVDAARAAKERDWETHRKRSSSV
jgi:hypothetical protein